MKFQTHNDTDVDVNMTSLCGYVHTGYDRLVDKFGKPTDGDGYKTDAEWNILFEDGKVATIYNWKNGENYCGVEGLETSMITEWHIGGHDFEVVERVNKIISQ